MLLESLLPRPNLAADAAAKLARSIRDGALVPGMRLPSETELARQLGVSRPVVREAIAYLRADGIVETRRGLGLFVNQQHTLRLRRSEIDESDQAILRFLEFRLGLEVEAAQLAALRRTPEDLVKIEGALTALNAADDAGLDSAEQDLKFHLAIAEAARNDLFHRVLEFVSGPLLSSIQSMRAKDRGAKRAVDLRRGDHDLIFDRIRAGDAVGAGAAMRRHIDDSYRRYADQMPPDTLASQPHPALLQARTSAAADRAL